MLTAAYHMLKNGVEYKDLGADHFSRRDRSKAIQRLIRRLNDLGCEVQQAMPVAPALVSSNGVAEVLTLELSPRSLDPVQPPSQCRGQIRLRVQDSLRAQGSSAAYLRRSKSA